jgi:hypothetical protein
VDLKTTKAGILALCMCAAPQIASAQTMQWTDTGYISVNGGAQVGSQTIDTSSTFPLYDETATISSSQKIKGATFFDVGGAYRVWGKNLLAGVTFSHVSTDADVKLTASIPDPVRFDSPRAVSSTQGGAIHTENAVHISVIWMIPVAKKLDVGIFAGPTIFSVKQDTVTTATVTEPGPTVTAPFTRVSKSTAGFHLGLDLQYMVAKRWGVGGIARYSIGSTSLEGATDNLKVGGFQIGGGARVRF